MIKPEEQVTHRSTAKQCQPALTPVFGTIMGKMASLAQCREICGIVVAWVMIEMCTRQHDTRRSRWWNGGSQIREPKLVGLQSVWGRQALRASAAIIPPLSAFLIIPSAVTEVEDIVAMETPAPFATALRALEADYLGQLSPIDRVKLTVFGADRHQTNMNHSALERKENSGENRWRFKPRGSLRAAL